MRAAVMRDKRLIVADVPVPEPAPRGAGPDGLACSSVGADEPFL
jgi:hypothetical protein